MDVETIKMSSKGQIVIPMDVRKEVHADEGTVFVVMGNNDTIFLKKIKTPSKDDLIKDLDLFAKKAKQKLQSIGVTEKDLQRK